MAWAETARARVELREIYDDDRSWATAWMRYLVQEPLGESFVLQPVGDHTPAFQDRTRLWYEPRLAFGAANHPTTRLAAAAVEAECRRRPGRRLLDVGTGNGVLAMIGVCSGASSALGIDIDPECVSAARHNAGINGLARNLSSAVEVGFGSLGRFSG